MPKEIKQQIEFKDETGFSDSENYFENVRYVKKLKLQRTVLNKLIGTDSDLPAEIANIDADATESN
ncbi:MAG: hypothetical protein ACOYMF_08430 [Bacteroidales bacterium]